MKLFYRNHNSSGSMVRVWRENWSSDAFEIMTKDSFENLIELGKRFGIFVEEADEGQD